MQQKTYAPKGTGKSVCFYAELALGEDRPEKGGNRMKRTGIKRAAALAMALIDLLRKSPEPTQPAAQKEEFEDGI